MNIYLPNLQLTFPHSNQINLVPFTSARYTRALTPVKFIFNCSFSLSRHTPSHNLNEVLLGESFEGIDIPYRWRILRRHNQFGIHLTFFENTDFLEAFSLIDLDHQMITTTLIPKRSNVTVTIDPLFHPLGSLIMVILAHHTGGMLVHSSGIKDLNRGFLFTGVSGIGKSTMASLWEKAGAQVINDDRLWLQKVNGIWHIFNTPMIHYSQEPTMAPLKAIFLLKQNKDNNISKMTGAMASMQFMANGIHHLYDKKMTAAHLDLVIDIASKVPIYQCAFKPDNEIVEQIKQLF